MTDLTHFIYEWLRPAARLFNAGGWAELNPHRNTRRAQRRAARILQHYTRTTHALAWMDSAAEAFAANVLPIIRQIEATGVTGYGRVLMR